MKTIVVTGANRGIGLEICRQLGGMGHCVILTARDAGKGADAVRTLSEQGGHVTFMKLDMEQEQSIDAFVTEMKRSYTSLDVLINNAAILEDSGYKVRTVPSDILDRMMRINFFGPLQLIRSLLPLLDQSNDPRIINISSGMGALSGMGPGYPAYRMSKTVLNSLTAVLAAEEPKIRINCVDPGWVQTDMGGKGASRPVSKGAETAVWLATEADVPTGKFLKDKKVVEW